MGSLPLRARSRDKPRSYRSFLDPENARVSETGLSATAAQINERTGRI